MEQYQEEHQNISHLLDWYPLPDDLLFDLPHLPDAGSQEILSSDGSELGSDVPSPRDVQSPEDSQEASDNMALDQTNLLPKDIEETLNRLKQYSSKFCKPKTHPVPKRINKISSASFWEHLSEDDSQCFKLQFNGFLEYQEGTPEIKNYIMLGPTVSYNNVGQIKPDPDWCWDTPQSRKPAGRMRKRTYTMKDKSPLKREVYSLVEEEDNWETTFKVVCISSVNQKKRQASPSGPLHIDGNNVGISSKPVYNPEYTLDVDGTIKAEVIHQTSDERSKNLLGKIDPQDHLDKVKQIDSYHFEYKKLPGKRQTGVIAQELQKIAPEVVHEEASGMLSVKPLDLITLSLGSIRALDENKADKKDVDAISKRVDAIEDSISKSPPPTPPQSQIPAAGNQYLNKGELDSKEKILKFLSTKEAGTQTKELEIRRECKFPDAKTTKRNLYDLQAAGKVDRLPGSSQWFLVSQSTMENNPVEQVDTN